VLFDRRKDRIRSGGLAGRGDRQRDNAGCCCEDAPARPVDGWDFGRVCGWRAMHAVSLSHKIEPSSWLGLEPGRKLIPSPRLAFMISRLMAKSINDIPKKKPGRPATGKGEGVLVRLQPSQLAALDTWIAKQNAPRTRPEAIRAMMDTILHILSKDRGEPAKKAKEN
jgi:hypothetical protein